MERWLRWTPLFLIAIPLIETALLGAIAKYTNSWLAPVIFVIVTGVIGTWLIRVQGIQAYRRIQDDMAHGRAPSDSIVDGALVLLGGVLLITPGVLTDLFGVALLIPLTRRWVRGALFAWFKRNFKATRVTIGPDGRPSADASDVVEGRARSSLEDEQQPKD